MCELAGRRKRLRTIRGVSYSGFPKRNRHGILPLGEGIPVDVVERRHGCADEAVETMKALKW